MFAHYDGTLEDCMCVKDFSVHACVMVDVSEVVSKFVTFFLFSFDSFMLLGSIG